MTIPAGSQGTAIPDVLPGGDIPITTPTWAGTSVPSATAAGATPPAPADAVKAMTQRILQTLAQNQQRKQFAGAPVPAAVPGMQDPNAARQIGMNTANPRAWGGQRLMAGISSSIQNAVAQKKDRDLRKAEADWTYMSSALNELYAAQSSGNPQAVSDAQAKVDVVMGDPKKLKAMAKALNQDWLNPEKTTVYGEALKKVTAKTEQTESNKQQAATGIKGLFQRLLQSKQQPQQQQPSLPQNWTQFGPKDAPGLVEQGNLDLTKRPIIQNADGSHSSEYSVSFENDKGQEVLVPTVVDGKFLTPDGKKPPVGSPEEKAMQKKAWEHYKETGQHLGIYDNPEHANAAANMIHSRDQRTQQQPGTKVGRVQLTPEQQKAMAREIVSKAPTTPVGTDLKSLELQEKVLHDRANEALAAKRDETASAYRKAELAIQEARLAEQRESKKASEEQKKLELKLREKTEDERIRHDKAMESIESKKVTSAGGAASGGAKLIGDAIIKGEQPPTTTGLYKEGAAVREYLAANHFNLQQAESDWKAVQKHLATLNGPQQERLRQAVTFTYESLDTIEDLYNQWQKTKLPSGFEDYNKAALIAAEKLPGDAGSIAHRLNSQINDLTSELGTVYKGGNASTDETLRLAAENLKAEWNDKTFHDAIGLVKTNLRIRKNSIDNSMPAGVSAGSPYTPKSETAAPSATGHAKSESEKDPMGIL